jgi:hypothetical protein
MYGRSSALRLLLCLYLHDVRIVLLLVLLLLLLHAWAEERVER